MTTNAKHAAEIESGDRFTFGDNWTRFLADLDDDRILAAENSLRAMLGVTDLTNRRFLDLGCGSGLFSLAARRLGALVTSFDYDPRSVACARELHGRHFPGDTGWRIEMGSVLDADYLARLGQFDIVYSWGVLHHTGAMYAAFTHLPPVVAPGGQLFIAIYNDQGWISRYWTQVKRRYNRGPFARGLLIAAHAPYLIGARWLARTLSGRGRLERGMSYWHDTLDWLGGYPFEVAKPEQVFKFFRERGFQLETLVTCGNRMGCNEFVFRRGE
ncbi:MAG: class I SAM-dependent methyltransferase [Thiotrichales bacterium]